MKTLFIALALCLAPIAQAKEPRKAETVASCQAQSKTFVRGYTTKHGVTVAAYCRKRPHASK